MQHWQYTPLHGDDRKATQCGREWVKLISSLLGQKFMWSVLALLQSHSPHPTATLIIALENRVRGGWRGRVEPISPTENALWHTNSAVKTQRGSVSQHCKNGTCAHGWNLINKHAQGGKKQTVESGGIMHAVDPAAVCVPVRLYASVRDSIAPWWMLQDLRAESSLRAR